MHSACGTAIRTPLVTQVLEQLGLDAHAPVSIGGETLTLHEWLATRAAS